MNRLKNLKLIEILTPCLLLVVFVSLTWAASNRVFTYTQKLTIEEDGGEFGNSYGFPGDIDGDAAMIAALTGDEGRGSVYYYEQIDGQWIEKQRFVTTDGILYGLPAYFDGNLALISNSVEGHTQNATSWGAVYAFERINGIWVEKERLAPSAFGGYFGSWLAMDGDTALISYVDLSSSVSALKVYEHRNGLWVETQTILPPDEQDEVSSNFGALSVLNGNLAWMYDLNHKSILGYEKVNGLWTHTITLDDISFTTDVNFWSEGDHLIGIETTENGTQAVAYHRDNGVWTREQTLSVATTFEPELVYRWEWVDGEADRIVLGGRIGVADARQLPQTHFFSVWDYQAGMWQETQRTEVVPETSNEDYHYQLYPALSGDTVMASFLDDAVYVYTDPELVPTATYTPAEHTLTPSVPQPTITPSLTFTPSSPIELLYDGSFEGDGNGDQIPDGWKLKHGTKDKMKCNKANKVIAVDGACVFQFKGGEGEGSKLLRNFSLAAHTVAVGNTLTLGGMVWAEGAVDS